MLLSFLFRLETANSSVAGSSRESKLEPKRVDAGQANMQFDHEILNARPES